MLLTLLYEFVLWIAALIFLPKLFYQMLWQGKNRGSLLQRLGIGFPTLPKEPGRKRVWIHAVSLGETRAITPLARKIKASPGNPFLIVTTTTETGLAEAKRSIPQADAHAHLPFDLCWIISHAVKRIQPDLVVLCEGDFWYNFLRCSRNQGARVILVNGKISERSLRRFMRFSWFSRPLFALIDRFCVQNALYASRFEKLGIPEDKITSTGNLKFDDATQMLSPVDLLALKTRLGIQEGDLTLVIGSTHDPEEASILDVLPAVWKAFPRLKVFFVPRHPGRFPEVAALFKQSELPYACFSQGPVDPAVKLVLVDAMGVLRNCYQVADLAIVAGSFTARVGGHNIVEPSAYGVPVLFGPYMHTQTELVDLVKEYGAGIQVTLDELPQQLIDLLGHSEKRKALGLKGKELIASSQGATERTWKVLESLLLEKA